MAMSLKRRPKFPPRPPRFATAIASSLLLPDDREVPARIKNLSENGVMVDVDTELPDDVDFGISIPGHGIFRAQVRWKHDGWIGARFHHPLDLGQFDT